MSETLTCGTCSKFDTKKYERDSIFICNRCMPASAKEPNTKACKRHQEIKSKIDDLGKEDYEPQKVSEAIAQLQSLAANRVIDLIDSVSKVEKVMPRVKGDIYTYQFYINDQVLIIPSDKMNTAKMFCQRYLEEFDKNAPVELSSKLKWNLFVDAFNECGKLIKIENKDISPDIFEAEKVLTELRNIPRTKDKAVYEKKRNLLEKDSKVYAPATIINEILESTHIKTPINRLLELIERYYIERVNVRTTPEKVVWSFVFKNTLFTDSSIALNSLEQHGEA